MSENSWPTLDWDDWAETCAHLHLMTQIVGKVRLSFEPWLNHSWHATFYVSPRGLTSGPIHHDDGCMSFEFDLIDHCLVLENASGQREVLKLAPGSIAQFYGDVGKMVRRAGAKFAIHDAPNELPDAIPFEDDVETRAYDAAAVSRYHRVLLRVDRVFEKFRTGYLGKSSPSHLFWGSFDLAVTRFSGREAPEHPGGVPNLPDVVTREAYSHEVSSAGFWPGNGGFGQAAFYAYAYPTPDGFADQPVEPDAAYWSDDLKEFVLPYHAVASARDPEAALMTFLESTFGAARQSGHWDEKFIRSPAKPRKPRAPM